MCTENDRDECARHPQWKDLGSYLVLGRELFNPEANVGVSARVGKGPNDWHLPASLATSMLTIREAKLFLNGDEAVWYMPGLHSCEGVIVKQAGDGQSRSTGTQRS